MTQEIKDRLEQAADKNYHPVSQHKPHFIAGAQTIIDNPKEWGLMPILESMDHIEESDQNWSEVVEDLKSQLAKYREALERIIDKRGYWSSSDCATVAKEALKKEVNND